jgi:hypothetical protein
VHLAIQGLNATASPLDSLVLNLPLCFHLLGATPQPQAESHASGTKGSPSWRCPKCGGPMKVIERFTAAELQLRSPPKVTAAA